MILANVVMEFAIEHGNEQTYDFDQKQSNKPNNSIKFNQIQFNSMQLNPIRFNLIQLNSIKFNSIMIKSNQNG